MISSNDPKWAEITLNKLKWTLMSVNQVKLS